MSFKQFSRGDVRYKGATIAQLTDAKVHHTNGAAIVKTLTGGVDGYHKGTEEGAITFTEAILKAGMVEDFPTIVAKKSVVKLTAIISDALAYEVEGIMQAADYTMSESGMVTGSFGVVGKITLITLS